MGIQKDIRALIDGTADDHELAIKLVEFSHENWEFRRQVGSWGPILYDRNRQVFLSIIESCVSPWALDDLKVIEPWMAEADRSGDLRLFRALYECWLRKSIGWGGAANRWRDDFLKAFREASDSGARREVIEKYSLWYDIEDDFALELYRTDPVVAKDFLIRRLDRLDWHEFVYTATAEHARRLGDEDFYFDLYRRTFSQATWTADVLQLAKEVSDPALLCAELNRRHLKQADHPVDIGTLCDLLKRRGADVLPYLERQVPGMIVWGSDNAWAKLMKLAWDGGHRKLWSIVVKTHLIPAHFAAEVSRLCRPGAQEWDRAACLAQIAGAQTGWSTWRRSSALDEKVAVELYDAFPELCRGPFAVHLALSQQAPYVELAKRASAARDDAMVDVLAAKAAVAGERWSRAPQTNLDWYVEHFSALDEETFARRAMNVLGQTAEIEHYGRAQVRSSNQVYRLFFGDVTRYRSQLGAVRDLLETPAEDVRRLALLLIADAGADGVDVAVRNADHLAAYLLNEASRGTRVAAFRALAVAALHSRLIADDVLFRAREALDLRRKRYPKDRLIELIGCILHEWPELRGSREHPVVYGQEAAW